MRPSASIRDRDAARKPKQLLNPDLDDVYLKSNMLLQKIKQDHLYLYVSAGGSPVCLFGVGGYILKWLET